MCNACHFVCCGMDVFSECGCDNCSNSKCWTLDDDGDFDGDDPAFLDLDFVPPPRPTATRGPFKRPICEAA